MKLWRKPVGIVLILLMFVSLLLFAFVFIANDSLNLRGPSDEKLIKDFRDNHKTFATLRDMLISDGSRFSSFNSSTVQSAIGKSRFEQYQGMLSMTHSAHMISRDNLGVVRFLFAGGGLSAVGAGWAKGIEYIPGDPLASGVLVSELDDARSRAPGVYLRRIDGNWYIFYQLDS